MGPVEYTVLGVGAMALAVARQYLYDRGADRDPADVFPLWGGVLLVVASIPISIVFWPAALDGDTISTIIWGAPLLAIFLSILFWVIR